MHQRMQLDFVHGLPRFLLIASSRFLVFGFIRMDSRGYLSTVSFFMDASDVRGWRCMDANV